MISAARSEFTTARTAVGKSVGAGLAAGFFGRKTVGRINVNELKNDSSIGGSLYQSHCRQSNTALVVRKHPRKSPGLLDREGGKGSLDQSPIRSRHRAA